MAGKGDKETPLMKQYNEIKRRHPGALLLFRVGDFYETFGDDAVQASKILNITLTKRANGAASEVALAGFPHHSLDNYLPRLVKAGLRVAVCDQLEDPKAAIGVVKRGVTELVTPGVALLDQVLDQNRNNYLASLHQPPQLTMPWGLALLDVSTGEFLCTEADLPTVERLLQHYAPSEVLYNKTRKLSPETGLQLNHPHGLDDWVWQLEFGQQQLTAHFGTASLKGFGIDTLPAAITAAGAVLHYLHETQHSHLGHITSIRRIEEEQYVWLDRFTLRNLELVEAQQQGGVPLLSIINKAMTPMGSRLMANWVQRPLKQLPAINARLDMVDALLHHSAVAAELAHIMRQVGDLERLVAKVAARRASPRDIVALGRSLAQVGPAAQVLEMAGHAAMTALANRMPNPDAVLTRITQLLREDAPAQLSQGNLIKPGNHEELDELRAIASGGKEILLQIQQREVNRTGITSLKVSFNKVFGYYLEVTHAHRDKVPADWIRKQTLVNAERYVTEELKVYEDKILNAEGRMMQLEVELFQQLLDELQPAVPALLESARTIAELDCLLSFARVAMDNNYCRPELNDGHKLHITAGRHPVIEKQLPPGEAYVPNDILLDNEEQQIIVITGPNMAGKSALLRQTALIVVLAQMGCYVPAERAEVGLVDKIFTRVGASDNLSRGESTFMVEMTETASILNNLSNRSLVLMDEIGRGTSTYDGVSIAWAIVEHLHNHPSAKARTLFATHYHELNELADQLPRIRNFNVAVKEVGNKIVFMRKLKPGGSEHSFGIHVAQLAGIPNPVVLRAHQIMHHLEKDRHKATQREKVKEMPKPSVQMSFFDPPNKELHNLGKLLEGVDINTVSPVEALLKLNDLKLLWERGKQS